MEQSRIYFRYTRLNEYLYSNVITIANHKIKGGRDIVDDILLITDNIDNLSKSKNKTNA